MQDHREAATEIIRRLTEAGHVAYFAGGCVRDELLGRTPEDYDVATDAPPDRIGALFRRTREVGRAFGVVLVRANQLWVEVATFRVEHGYSDGRRPDAVTFCNAEQDALRRDFTINALFIDPLDTGDRPGGRVIDHVRGLDDLDDRIVRAVGDPEERLAEDNLRALRAVRFASRLGFTLDDRTAEAVRKHATELAGVSRERIGDELRRMLGHARRADAAAHIQALGLDGPSFDEAAMGPVSLDAMAGLGPDASFPVALAAWAIDRAAASGAPRQAGPLAARASGVIPRWRAALCLTNDERDAMRHALATLKELAGPWDSFAVARRKRLAASSSYPSAVRLLEVLDAARAAAITAEVTHLATLHGGLAPIPLLNGDDLIAAGFLPGPTFGTWLNAAYDAQLEGRIASQDEALAIVRDLAAGDQ
jgi:poly(A) polymerase